MSIDAWLRHTSRRNFLRDLGVVAAATGAVGCKPGDQGAGSAGKADTGAKSPAQKADQTGGTMAANPAVATTTMSTADQMDAMHEKGIKSFPAQTALHGNQPLAPRIENGVKVFDLTCTKIQWEVTPGQMVEAWAYNDQVPGPLLRVKEGDRVRAIVQNQLPESTSIHWHGVELENSQDGVPFITQPPIKPGQTFTYEFTATNSGSHMYHSHHNSTKQVGLGMLGAFIVDPKTPGQYDKPDVERIMILNDVMGGYTLNGKGFPATVPIVCKLGQTVRIRYMNEGMMIHPMHLHGIHQLVIAKDAGRCRCPIAAIR
jgi:FtsP/CotA-like multicopper oxidase with cupredoxin domain